MIKTKVLLADDNKILRHMIKKLLNSQDDIEVTGEAEDETWDEDEFTGTGIPKVFYLRYHMYRSYFPLLTLSKYRNTVGSSK
jgi:squalene cyclase